MSSEITIPIEENDEYSIDIPLEPVQSQPSFVEDIINDGRANRISFKELRAPISQVRGLKALSIKTKRNSAIIILYIKGYSVNEVADSLNLSRSAVYYHFQKLKKSGVVIEQIKPSVKDTLIEEGVVHE